MWRPRNEKQKNKNKQTNKAVKLLCLYLVSDKRFQSTFANQFWKSSITISCKTLSGVCLQHALHRDGVRTSHPWQGLWGAVLVFLAQCLGSLQPKPALIFGSELGVCCGSSAERFLGHSPSPPFPPHFIHYQKAREKTPKSGSLSSYPSHFWGRLPS